MGQAEWEQAEGPSLRFSHNTVFLPKVTGLSVLFQRAKRRCDDVGPRARALGHGRRWGGWRRAEGRSRSQPQPGHARQTPPYVQSPPRPQAQVFSSGSPFSS